MATKPKFDGKRPRDHTTEASPCVITDFIPMRPPFTDEDIEIFRTRIRDPRGWAAIAHYFAPKDGDTRQDQQPLL